MSYIVPRDIPKNCFECPCCTLGYCRVDVKTTEYAKYVFSDGQDGRYSDCPLIELPSHGRLADLDKMINDFWDCDSMIIGNYELEKIETVIEGSET